MTASPAINPLHRARNKEPVAMLCEVLKHPDEWQVQPGRLRHQSGMELCHRLGLAYFSEKSRIVFPLSLWDRWLLGRAARKLVCTNVARVFINDEERSAFSAMCLSIRLKPQDWEVCSRSAVHRPSGTALVTGDGFWFLRFTPDSRLRFRLGPLNRICLWVFLKRLILRA
jgi:hypothetical protein